VLGSHAEALYAQNMVGDLCAVESLVGEARSLGLKGRLFSSLCGSTGLGKVETEGSRLANGRES